MTLLRWGGVSLAWSCFKWFFSASASADPGVPSCGGFASWPTFGFKALDLTWNFDSSLTYIGVGAPLRTPPWPPRAAPADPEAANPVPCPSLLTHVGMGALPLQQLMFFYYVYVQLATRVAGSATSW